jgi:hypothetical protein
MNREVCLFDLGRQFEYLAKITTRRASVVPVRQSSAQLNGVFDVSEAWFPRTIGALTSDHQIKKTASISNSVECIATSQEPGLVFKKLINRLERLGLRLTLPVSVAKFLEWFA